MTTSVRTYRRYLLLKVQYHTLLDEPELASANLAKHNATTGTPFPDNVPFQAALRAANYTAVEDVLGADAEELIEQTGLTFEQSKAVLVSISHRLSSAPTMVCGVTSASLHAATPSSQPTLNAAATGHAA